MSAISAHCVCVFVLEHISIQCGCDGAEGDIEGWHTRERKPVKIETMGILCSVHWHSRRSLATELAGVRHTKRMLLDVECNEWLNMPDGVGLPHWSNRNARSLARSPLMLYVFVLSRPAGQARTSSHFSIHLWATFGAGTINNAASQLHHIHIEWRAQHHQLMHDEWRIENEKDKESSGKLIISFFRVPTSDA